MIADFLGVVKLRVSDELRASKHAEFVGVVDQQDELAEVVAEGSFVQQFSPEQSGYAAPHIACSSSPRSRFNTAVPVDQSRTVCPSRCSRRCDGISASTAGRHMLKLIK